MRFILIVTCLLPLVFASRASAQSSQAISKAFVVEYTLDVVERRLSEQRIAVPQVPSTYTPIAAAEPSVRPVARPEPPASISAAASRPLRPWQGTKEPVESLEAVKDFVFGQRASPDSNISLGIVGGYLTGYSTYHISFDNDISIGGHGESELEWPLNNFVWGLQATFNYKGTMQDPTGPNRAGLRASWLTTAEKDSDMMKDSDWIENDIGFIDFNDDGVVNGSSAWATDNPGLDIFSESTTRVEGCTIFDVNYNYNFFVWDYAALGLLAGFRYQHFSFSAYNLDEIGYGPYGPGPFDLTLKDDRNRRWIDYTISSQLPYIGTNTEFAWGELSVFAQYGYCGWGYLKDQDVHRYPDADEATGHDINMVSEGETNRAQAHLVKAACRWRLGPQWSLDLGFDYTWLKAKKTITEHNEVDGVEVSATEPIDELVSSESQLYTLSVHYLF